MTASVARDVLAGVALLRPLAWRQVPGHNVIDGVPVNTVDVHTGQVKAASGSTALRAAALGSCVAVIAYDPRHKNAAIAHVMLPGEAPRKEKPDQRTKYASDAIGRLTETMARLGSEKSELRITLAGGANVLKRTGDTIAASNIRSILSILGRHNLRIVAQSLGGTCRRNVSIDIENGVVNLAVGDQPSKQLWRA